MTSPLVSWSAKPVAAVTLLAVLLWLVTRRMLLCDTYTELEEAVRWAAKKECGRKPSSPCKGGGYRCRRASDGRFKWMCKSKAELLWEWFPW